MIKNASQYKRTLVKITELQQAKAIFQNDNPDSTSGKYQFGTNSFDALLSDLIAEKNEYEKLTNGGLQIIDPKSLENIPIAMIQARIALGLTQKEFAAKLRLKEQQVQRYESEDYQGVSFSRLLDFCDELGIKFYIEKVIIYNSTPSHFSFPEDIKKENITTAAEKVRSRGSLIIA